MLNLESVLAQRHMQPVGATGASAAPGGPRMPQQQQPPFNWMQKQYGPAFGTGQPLLQGTAPPPQGTPIGQPPQMQYGAPPPAQNPPSLLGNMMGPRPPMQPLKPTVPQLPNSPQQG